MIGRLLAITLPGFAVGALMMALGGRRVEPEVRRARWVKFVVYFVIVHTVLAAAAAGRWWIELLVYLVLGAGGFEMVRAAKRLRMAARAGACGVLLLLGVLAVLNTSRLAPQATACLYVIVAVFDGFSQVSGQLMGRRRLAPRISPGKTVEGLAGGLVGAVLVAAVLHDLLGTNLEGGVLVGAATGLAALAGDLAASWVKRASGIKDYSCLLPGHGGVLDRFDSFLAAAAVVGAFL